jgi:CopG family nickel-responsive transcriptional regulator
MSHISRFGVSMDATLLEQFDQFITNRGYSNRSEAVRDLVRNELVKAEWEHDDEETVGTLTLIFDHHQRELQNRLTGHQHKHHDMIISTMHVHLDHHHCLEVLAVKGRVEHIRQLADEMLSMKGVKHGKLVMTSTGKHI